MERRSVAASAGGEGIRREGEPVAHQMAECRWRLGGAAPVSQWWLVSVPLPLLACDGACLVGVYARPGSRSLVRPGICIEIPAVGLF